MCIQWKFSKFTYPQIEIYKRPCFPIAALSLSCVLVVILFIFPNSNFLGVVGFLVVVLIVLVVLVVTCIVVFNVGFVVGSEGSVVTFVVDLIVGFVVGSEDLFEGLIVIVEVIEVVDVCDVVKGVFRYGKNTEQNCILQNFKF